MANSDNVLRGGLTSKHIDVPELLRHLQSEPIEPDILDPVPNEAGIREFPVPVNDFSICSVELSAGQTLDYPAGPSCLILAPEGALEVRYNEVCLHLGSPEPCLYVAPNTGVRIRALSPCVLFIASGEQGQLG
jgi:mannose-6-phosphate isomerase